MGTIQLFSIRKLKAGAASVALGLLMLSHQVSADEKETGGPAVPEETIHAAEDIVLQDEVIFQGENYNLSDNIVDTGGPAVVEVIDMTDKKTVNTDIPGQYTGTVTLVLENNETIQRTVNIIVKESANTDSSNNSADELKSEKPDETAGSDTGSKTSEDKEQPEQEQTEVPKDNDKELEDVQNPSGSGEDVTGKKGEDQEKDGDSKSTEKDTEAGENQDNDDSDESSGTEDQEKDDDSESTEEDTKTGGNQGNDEQDESSETEDQEKDDDSEPTEEDAETGENQNSDEQGESSETEDQEKDDDSEPTEEDAETGENQNSDEQDESSETEDQEKVDDSESPEEDTDTGNVVEPENSYEETPSEGNDEAPEDSVYPEYEVSDDNGSETPADTEETPKITEMKSSDTAGDLDDYMTEDEIAEILGDINLDLEHSNDDEVKRELTRSLLKYLSDLQQGSEYHAVSPPGSRVMTKGEFQKDRDSLYPLNPDKFYNKGDFTADARVEWVAVADYTRDSITPTGNHLYLLDGRNPLSRGHFEVQHYETVNEQNDSIAPVFRVSVGTVDSLEDISIIFRPGAGPDGVNWNFDNRAEVTMHRGNEFKMSSDIAVSKRFGEAVDMSEDNIEMNVLEGDHLQVKIKKMNAGEHFMFSVTGSPLNSDGVLKREHFVADARLSADFA